MTLTEWLQRYENLTLLAAVTAYLLAMLLLWAHLFFNPEDASPRAEQLHHAAAKWGKVALAAGVVSHACSLSGQGEQMLAQRIGVAGLFGWGLAVAYLLFGRAPSRATLGAFVAPVVFLAALFSMRAPELHRGTPDVQLQTQWLIVHVSIFLIGFIALAVAFAAALLYLIQEGLLKRKQLSGLWHRLPPLQVADEIIYRATSFGLAMWTLGVMSGFAWMQKHRADYSPLADPTAIFTMVVWLTFALYLAARWWLGWRGRRTNMVVIYGFVLLVISFIGAPHVLGSVAR